MSRCDPRIESKCITDLDIIYNDERIVAINKPAGLLVHRSSLDFHEKYNAQELLQEHIGTRVFPAHRLDKPTSGVLLFAKDQDAVSILATQFQQQQITKQYVAVVRGYTQDTGTIDNPVRDRDAPQKPRKPALTSYKTIAQLELPHSLDRYASTRYSFVQVQPLSGRKHQIRQHFKHISHPLIGDSSYGKTIHNQFFEQQFGSYRLLLHAESLTFKHPESHDIHTLLAQHHDEQFDCVLKHCAWQWLSEV